MDGSGEAITHKYIRTESSKVGNSNVHKIVSKGEGNSLTDGQYCSSIPHCENGGNKKSTAIRLEQADMGVYYTTGNHNYSRTFTRETQCGGGCTVSVSEGLQRMEVMPICLQETVPGSMGTINRSICLQGFEPTSKVHVLEAGPFQSGNGCFSNRLGKSRSLCVSTVLPHFQSSKKSTKREGNIDINNPGMANSALVSQGPRNVYKKSDFNSKNKEITFKSKQRSSSTSTKPQSTTDGLDSLRERLTAEGISEKTASLITDSRRGSSLSHYESAWRKWSSWCNERDVDPIRCTINFVLDFLSDSYDKGLSYNTIAGYRSAISAFHEPIDGSSVGKHPHVSAILTGVFNNRYPQPKYQFIWDVDVVTKFLVTLGDNQDLDDKTLTKKLTILLALTSASKSHEIDYLDIRFLVKHHSGYTFSFSKPTKVTRKGKLRPAITFVPFEENSRLCVCNCIDTYLIRSRSWREDKNQLLLSYVKPHKEISAKTVSKWITDILDMAGVDISTFSGHSTRSAASSKAKFCGVPTKEILKRGYWTNESTFQKHYSREIDSNNLGVFQKSILSFK